MKKFNKSITKLQKEGESRIKGIDGEKAVFEELKRILDKDKYYIKPNFVIPGKSFDLDVIVIGPKGLIVFEIKNCSGQTVFQEDNVSKFYNKGSIKTQYTLSNVEDPRIQLKISVEKLINYLKQKGFDNIMPRKAVVFARENSFQITENTKTGIFIIDGINNIEKYLDNLSYNPIFTPEFVEKLKMVF